MSSLDSFLNGFGSAVSGTIANKAHAHPSWLNYEKDIVSWSVLRRLGYAWDEEPLATGLTWQEAHRVARVCQRLEPQAHYSVQPVRMKK